MASSTTYINNLNSFETSLSSNGKSSYTDYNQQRIPYMTINCNLCGGNGASVRCEKCNSMAFCIGCDDMYHRHPKRRTHLRQAVALEFISANVSTSNSLHSNRSFMSPTANASSSSTNLSPSSHHAHLGDSQSTSADQTNGVVKPDTSILYPWRRTIRTMPRMPDNYSWEPSLHPANRIGESNGFGLRQSKSQASSPLPSLPALAPPPSKMPIPPPRRKKKLSFSGLKDTFRRFVGSDKSSSSSKHHYNSQPSAVQPEPIYAKLRPIQPINLKSTTSVPALNFANLEQRSLQQPQHGHQQQNQRKFSNSSSVSPATFRPLPALPRDVDGDDDDYNRGESFDPVYENMRKMSLPAIHPSHNHNHSHQSAFKQKTKLFASSSELSRPEVEDPGDLGDSSRRGSTLPRKNHSYHDLTQQSPIVTNMQQHQTQVMHPYPGYSAMGWPNPGSSCTPDPHHHHLLHGSSQSVFAGLCSPQQPPLTPSNMMIPPPPGSPMFFNYPNGPQCPYHWGHHPAYQSSHHHNHQSQQPSPTSCPSCRGNHPRSVAVSMTNSLEELRHNRSFVDDDDDVDYDNDNELTDDEDGSGYHPNPANPHPLGRNAKNRNRRHHASSNLNMRRTQSSFSMYPNIEDSSQRTATPSGNNNHLESSSPIQQQQTNGYHTKKTKNHKNAGSSFSSSSSTSYDTNNEKTTSTTTNVGLSASAMANNRTISASAAAAAASLTSTYIDSDSQKEEEVNHLGQWSCRFCTFFNDSYKNICEICCKTRLKPIKKVSTTATAPTTSNQPNLLVETVPSTSSTTTSNLPDEIVVFDEKMIREQMEIERELERRRQNEIRIEEENQRLFSTTNEDDTSVELKCDNQPTPPLTKAPSSTFSLKKPEIVETVECLTAKPISTLTSSSSKIFKDETEAEDTQAIVARLIEEKILEKFNQLKLVQQEEEAKSRKEPEQINQIEKESAKVVDSIVEQKMPEKHTELVQASTQSQASTQASTQTPALTSSTTIQPTTIFNQQQPQQIDVVQFNQPNQLGFVQSQQSQNQPLVQSNQQNFDVSVQSMNPYSTINNQPIPFQQQQQPATMYGSNQYLNANGGMTSTVQQQYTPQFNQQQQPQPLPLQQQQQQSRQFNNNWNPADPSSTLSSAGQANTNKMMLAHVGPYSRHSSFDDSQSMSSVTSSSLFYPNQMESGLQIIQTLRDAEKKGYNADDVEIAIQFNPSSPLDWLDENWQNMCETVLTMANNQIIDMEQNNGAGSKFGVGLTLVNDKDARIALRVCKGNIWQAVEKCIQRYQDNKLFNNNTTTSGSNTTKKGNLSNLEQQKQNKQNNVQLSKKSTTGGLLKSMFTPSGGNKSQTIKSSPNKSFSLNVVGLGSGRANNDAPMIEQISDDSEDHEDDDLTEEVVENLMNPNYEDHGLSRKMIQHLQMEEYLVGKTPMESFLDSDDNVYVGEDDPGEDGGRNELLEMYIRKLTDDVGVKGVEFDRNQMEELLYSWRYEKELHDRERERYQIVEREKQKMQKMIEVQRRIGGYLSDGTTTEEELDREVERVFSQKQNHQELKTRLERIELQQDDEEEEDPTPEVGKSYYHHVTRNGNQSSETMINDDDNLESMMLSPKQRQFVEFNNQNYLVEQAAEEYDPIEFDDGDGEDNFDEIEQRIQSTLNSLLKPKLSIIETTNNSLIRSYEEDDQIDQIEQQFDNSTIIDRNSKVVESGKQSVQPNDDEQSTTVSIQPPANKTKKIVKVKVAKSGGKMVVKSKKVVEKMNQSKQENSPLEIVIKTDENSLIQPNGLQSSMADGRPTNVVIQSTGVNQPGQSVQSQLTTEANQFIEYQPVRSQFIQPQLVQSVQSRTTQQSTANINQFDESQSFQQIQPQTIQSQAIQQQPSQSTINVNQFIEHQPVQAQLIQPVQCQTNQQIQQQPTQPQSIQSQSTQSQMVQPQLIQPQSIQSQSTQFQMVQPQLILSQSTQSQMIQPQSTQSQMVQQQPAQCQMAQPQSTQSQMVQQQPTQSQMVQQQATQSQMAQPQSTQSQMVQQQPTQSQMVQQQPTQSQMVQQQPTQSQMVQLVQPQSTQSQMVQQQPTQSQMVQLVQQQPTQSQMVQLVQPQSTQSQMVQQQPTQSQMVQLVQQQPTQSQMVQLVQQQPTQSQMVQLVQPQSTQSQMVQQQPTQSQMVQPVQPQQTHSQMVQPVQQQPTQSQMAQPQSTQFQMVQPQSIQSQSTQSQMVQPQSTQSQSTQSQMVQPQSIQSQSTQSQMVQPQSTQSQSTQSQMVQPQLTQSQSTQSQMVQPVQQQLTQPQSTQSQIVQPVQSQSLMGQTFESHQFKSMQQQPNQLQSIQSQSVQQQPIQSQLVQPTHTTQLQPVQSRLIQSVATTPSIESTTSQMASQIGQQQILAQSTTELVSNQLIQNVVNTGQQSIQPMDNSQLQPIHQQSTISTSEINQNLVEMQTIQPATAVTQSRIQQQLQLEISTKLEQNFVEQQLNTETFQSEIPQQVAISTKSKSNLVTSQSATAIQSQFNSIQQQQAAILTDSKQELVEQQSIQQGQQQVISTLIQSQPTISTDLNQELAAAFSQLQPIQPQPPVILTDLNQNLVEQKTIQQGQQSATLTSVQPHSAISTELNQELITQQSNTTTQLQPFQQEAAISTELKQNLVEQQAIQQQSVTTNSVQPQSAISTDLKQKLVAQQSTNSHSQIQSQQPSAISTELKQNLVEQKSALANSQSQPIQLQSPAISTELNQELVEKLEIQQGQQPQLTISTKLNQNLVEQQAIQHGQQPQQTISTELKQELVEKKEIQQGQQPQPNISTNVNQNLIEQPSIQQGQQQQSTISTELNQDLTEQQAIQQGQQPQLTISTELNQNLIEQQSIQLGQQPQPTISTDLNQNLTEQQAIQQGQQPQLTISTKLNQNLIEQQSIQQGQQPQPTISTKSNQNLVEQQAIQQGQQSLPTISTKLNQNIVEQQAIQQGQQSLPTISTELNQNLVEQQSIQQGQQLTTAILQSEPVQPQSTISTELKQNLPIQSEISPINQNQKLATSETLVDSVDTSAVNVEISNQPNQEVEPVIKSTKKSKSKLKQNSENGTNATSASANFEIDKFPTESNATISAQRRDLSEEQSQHRRWSRSDYSVDFQWARTEFECDLCTETTPIDDIVAMISCTHFACRSCLKRYYTVQIRERQRLVITCPFCDEPKLDADDDERVFDFLAMFDQFIRYIVDQDVYELFQRKQCDRALMRDPNFQWCTQCSSGFIAPNAHALTVMCPDCRCLTCRKCKRLWRKQHFNLTCEAYGEWEMSNDPEYAEQQLNKHLKEFGIECPNCKFRYQLAKGGCMHFRCIQCSYDFCGGCSRPFKLGSRCFKAKICEKLGLHAHHPRHCLFYLRDKEVADLQRLLQNQNVEYRTELEGDQQVARCLVMEQKETDSGMKDEKCNRFVEAAGLCKLHYKEYLGLLIFQNKIDPIHIFNEDELELVLRRENIRLPKKPKVDSEYIAKLVSVIQEKLPLDGPTDEPTTSISSSSPTPTPASTTSSSSLRHH